jgi:molecular chaperone GrpE (heat shock protein)
MPISPEFRKKLDEAKAEDRKANFHEAIAEMVKEAEETETEEPEQEEQQQETEESEPETESIEESQKAELHSKKMQILAEMEKMVKIEESHMELDPVISKYLLAISILERKLADNFTLTGKVIPSEKEGYIDYIHQFHFFKNGKEINFEQFTNIIKPEGWKEG